MLIVNIKAPSFPHLGVKSEEILVSVNTLREAYNVIRKFLQQHWKEYLPIDGPNEDYPALESIDIEDAIDRYCCAFDDNGAACSITGNGVKKLWGRAAAESLGIDMGAKLNKNGTFTLPNKEFEEPEDLLIIGRRALKMNH